MPPRQSIPPTHADSVDLREYVTVLRTRLPIILISAVLGLGAAFGYSALQTPIYTAQAEVLVNPPAGSTNQNLSQVISIDTEARLVTSAPIAEAAAKALHSRLTITGLLKHVSVQTTTDTFVLNIQYWDPKPSQAAAGANAFAKAYLDYKREQAQTEATQQQTAIENKIAQLHKQERAQNEILQTATPGTAEYRNAQDALDRINVQLAVLASSLASIPAFVDPGELILPATPPASYSSPKYPLNMALGLFLGLFGGVVAAFALDRVDDRVRRRTDLQAYLNVPVLAYIPHVRNGKGERPAQLIVDLEPRSPVAEAYRTIRTNVLSMARKRDLRVFAVASAMQREGKSITAANLAAALGQADRRVLVLSADIRKPTIHEFFGVSNTQGLSAVLEGDLPIAEAILSTDVDNVWALPGGMVPANPAELLQSPSMAEVLTRVRTMFDLVVIDCPPILGLADCLAVLPLVDAVLLVVQAGHTHGGAIVEASDQLERVGVTVDAAVLNDVKVPRGRPGHRGYGYYLAASDYLRPEERDPDRPAPRLVSSRPAAEAVGADPAEQQVGGPRVQPAKVRGPAKQAGQVADQAEHPAAGTVEEP